MQSFPIVPAGPRPLWILVPICLLLVGAIVLLAGAALASQRARFEVSSEGLRLRGDLYGRFIPASALLVAEARPVDLTREPELRVKRRTLGSGLPGYQAGWFRLQNGEKALLYVTDPGRVVRLPTREGYVVMLSVAEPDRFLQALRTGLR